MTFDCIPVRICVFWNEFCSIVFPNDDFPTFTGRAVKSDFPLGGVWSKVLQAKRPYALWDHSRFVPRQIRFDK